MTPAPVKIAEAHLPQYVKTAAKRYGAAYVWHIPGCYQLLTESEHQTWKDGASC